MEIWVNGQLVEIEDGDDLVIEGIGLNVSGIGDQINYQTFK